MARKKFKIAFAVLAISLLVLAGMYFAGRATVYQSNSTPRSDKTDEGLSVSITPRSGASGSWEKLLSDGARLTGTVFDMSVDNVADCEISQWTMRFDVTKDCYLNNGWCGTFEVHQFEGRTERACSIDLRSYTVSQIVVKYVMDGQDLLIPLHPGDYVIYHPSKAVFEEPLTKEGTASVGFILYYEGDAPDFSGAEATFYYNRKYTESSEFIILLIAIGVWAVACVVALSLRIYARNTEKELEKRDKRLEESIGIFSGFVDAKDTYTNGHSKRVALYAEKIAAAMGYSKEACRNVYFIGLMHDCGKCYISDEILKKPGRLTNEEFAVIKSHTTYGAKLLDDFKSLENMKEGALYHHERFDGTGYPCRKAGKDIPEIARILCVADSFDAMNSRRVYREPLSKEIILSELVNGRDTQFDPDILDVFLQLIESGAVVIGH